MEVVTMTSYIKRYLGTYKLSLLAGEIGLVYCDSMSNAIECKQVKFLLPNF